MNQGGYKREIMMKRSDSFILHHSYNFNQSSY